MTPTNRSALIADIAAIADQLDRHNGTKPGTAIRGIYFWCWPPEICGLDTLQALHRDAVGFLADATATDPTYGDPCQLCTRPLETPDEVIGAVCDACQVTLHLQPRPRKKEKPA